MIKSVPQNQIIGTTGGPDLLQTAQLFVASPHLLRALEEIVEIIGDAIDEPFDQLTSILDLATTALDTYTGPGALVKEPSRIIVPGLVPPA
jgi:hypothetical protein